MPLILLEHISCSTLTTNLSYIKFEKTNWYNSFLFRYDRYWRFILRIVRKISFNIYKCATPRKNKPLELQCKEQNVTTAFTGRTSNNKYTTFLLNYVHENNTKSGKQTFYLHLSYITVNATV